MDWPAPPVPSRPVPAWIAGSRLTWTHISLRKIKNQADPHVIHRSTCHSSRVPPPPAEPELAVTCARRPPRPLTFFCCCWGGGCAAGAAASARGLAFTVSATYARVADARTPGAVLAPTKPPKTTTTCACWLVARGLSATDKLLTAGEPVDLRRNILMPVRYLLRSAPLDHCHQTTTRCYAAEQICIPMTRAIPVVRPVHERAFHSCLKLAGNQKLEANVSVRTKALAGSVNLQLAGNANNSTPRAGHLYFATCTCCTFWRLPPNPARAQRQAQARASVS